LTTEYEIVVVGGGIAGLSAALTAARLGRNTLVLTGDVLGGHLLNIERIDGYPGFSEGVAGYDLCPIAQEQATEAGAAFAMTRLEALERDGDNWRIKTPSESYLAGSVILATGTELRELGVPGETLLRGKGVSQCASCDAPLLRDKPVVVAGGGDSALQEALVLAEHCSSVTVVHHGTGLTAQAAYVTQAEPNAKISFLPNSEISKILGEAAVEGVRIRNLESGDESELECAAVFGFIGLTTNTAFLDDAAILAGTGGIVTDAEMRTRHPGLLAAGTVRANSTGRAAAAAGDGSAAALAASRFLADGEWPSG
jgi:thioredoxin reductase (NADPH)